MKYIYLFILSALLSCSKKESVELPDKTIPLESHPRILINKPLFSKQDTVLLALQTKEGFRYFIKEIGADINGGIDQVVSVPVSKIKDKKITIEISADGYLTSETNVYLNIVEEISIPIVFNSLTLSNFGTNILGAHRTINNKGGSNPAISAYLIDHGIDITFDRKQRDIIKIMQSDLFPGLYCEYSYTFYDNNRLAKIECKYASPGADVSIVAGEPLEACVSFFGDYNWEQKQGFNVIYDFSINGFDIKLTVKETNECVLNIVKT